MKTFLALFIVISSSIVCSAQTLFFDNLNNSTWTSESYINEKVIGTMTEIPLRKLNFAKDSLRSNVTIWSFKNKMVTVRHYNSMQKNETKIGSYKYQIDRGKGVLKIFISDNNALNFNVWIVSTGNYALLTREKK